MRNDMNKFKSTNSIILVFLMLTGLVTNTANSNETWIDYNNNTQLNLANDGTFQFTNASSITQGSYRVQDKVLMMQDTSGNYYQYNVISYSTEQMVLRDQNGVSYSYVHKPQNQSSSNDSLSNTHFPWENSQYSQVLSQSKGYQWKERENWIYVEFLQFLIGQPISQSEVIAIRQDFITQFNQRPEAFINETNEIEKAMKQVYSLTNLQQVAMVREEMSTLFNNLVKQQPQMNNYAFVQTLNKYVRILSVDTHSNLSLSNQDVTGYLNYLQFQAMLMGQDYQLTQQDRMALQFKIVDEFNNYPTEQKQVLAFAGFIWDNLVLQWSNMNVTQQQQYIMQVQSQMNVQNVSVNSQTATNFWNNSNQYNSNSSYSHDYGAQAYLDYTQRMRETDNMIYTAIQNNMTENHVTMMNMFNTDSDYEYVVDYGNNY